MKKLSIRNLKFKAYFEMEDCVCYPNDTLDYINIINLSILQILVMVHSYLWNHTHIDILEKELVKLGIFIVGQP
jgi:hypothetical protein